MTGSLEIGRTDMQQNRQSGTGIDSHENGTDSHAAEHRQAQVYQVMKMGLKACSGTQTGRDRFNMKDSSAV